MNCEITVNCVFLTNKNGKHQQYCKLLEAWQCFGKKYFLLHPTNLFKLPIRVLSHSNILLLKRNILTLGKGAGGWDT